MRPSIGPRTPKSSIAEAPGQHNDAHPGRYLVPHSPWVSPGVVPQPLSNEGIFLGEMAKDSRKNHGLLCLGVKSTGQKCKNARNKSGAPVVMNKVCPHCGEQRCKKHCKCKRDLTVMAKGRHAARGPREEKPPARAPPVAVPAPVGRASAPTTELLTSDDWYRRCCEDISRAAEVELASYVYDNPSVQTALLKRFKSNKAFHLNVYVDVEQLGRGEAGEESGFAKAFAVLGRATARAS